MVVGELQKLKVIVERVANGRRVIAAMVYGSRVSGYARPDSDYDLLVVVDKLRPRAKYVYGNYEEIYYSVLLVDEKAFRKDCSSAALGEFVSGRLLNRYQPITGETFLNENEAVLKRRVVVEGLQELFARYGPFTQHFILTSAYFLFNKLKKRAFIYPPVVYSYVKTYSGFEASVNTQASLECFDRQMDALCNEGILRKEAGGYRVEPEAEKKLKVSPIAPTVRLATTGVKQYVTHGLAGNVGAEVAIKELISKIGRSRSKTSVPENLEEPRTLLSLPEGKLVFGGDWVEKAVEQLGAEQPYTSQSSPLGDFFSTATLHTVKSKSGEYKFVSKHYQDIWSLKWMVASVVALSARTFEARPLYRMSNEYEGLLRLKGLGVKTPRVLVVAPDDKVMVLEHLIGVPLEEMIRSKNIDLKRVEGYCFQFGSTLGVLHSKGMTMGDTKPTNVLCTDSSISIVDLEQFQRGGDEAWDVAEFAYYCATLAGEEVTMRLMKSFVSGYLQHGEKDVLYTASEESYIIPFQMLVQPPILGRIKEMLKGVA
jgi:tRNA A-37 threonylcarbamoyl transferase component Bud32/predicted nucleotidyltransferase